ncbi:integrase DNA-binding domain-containing protein [Clostridioides difficile]
MYSWKLVSTNRVPAGKRDCISLREKKQDKPNFLTYLPLYYHF